jgi:diacylglycerol kinase family enzyme
MSLKNRLVSLLIGIIITIHTYESNPCKISLDGGREKLLGRMTMCIIANRKFLGDGFKAAPQANVPDGIPDVVILKDSGSLKIRRQAC